MLAAHQYAAFSTGNFVDRCREMGEILQGIVQPVTDLVQKVEELSLQTNKLAQHQCGIAQQELSQLLYRVAAPLLYQVRFSAVWQDHHVVLQLALDGVAQNLHLLHTLLQELRSYLPPNWKIALPSWKTFVEEHYPDEPRQSTIDQLLAHERTYSTSLPPEAASYEAHLQLTSGWTTQPMLMFEYLQDENFVFNLLRLSGSFCGFIAYNTNIFSSQDDLVSEVRAFNAQLAKSVQQSLDDPAAVQFVGGGYGAGAFAIMHRPLIATSSPMMPLACWRPSPPILRSTPRPSQQYKPFIVLPPPIRFSKSLSK